ncbi:MAG: Do family serine endopeptidase [Nitrospirales bacterium]|nr:Do family serine endopeptidase [Nitrospirales bacterium]
MKTTLTRLFSFLLIALIFMTNPAFSAVNLENSKGLQVLEEIQNSLTQLAEHVTPTVVNISPIRSMTSSKGFPQPKGPRVPGSGSGVIIHEDGYVVTNNHVIGADTTEAEVRLSDESKFIAQVIGRDQDTDLALLKINTDRDLPTAEFGDSASLKVGQWVLAVGNPMGLDRTVTLGVVSGIGREQLNLSRYENFIQTDAAINPGNSGGPLFNLRGEVVGINTAIIHMAQGIGFSIPSNMVKKIVGQLRKQGRVVRGWLGVGIQPLTPELAAKFGVEEGKGVLVNEVFENDPAHLAGIQPGDIIIKVQNKPVETPNQLSRRVAFIGPGETATLDIIRDGKPLIVKVAMGERQEKAIVASLPLEKSEITLGIDVQGLTAALAEKFGLKERFGVLVSKVERGSLAHNEGIKEGDLIKEVNRQEVRSVSDFSAAMEKAHPGDTILLRVVRGSRAFFVVLKTQG